MHQLPSTILRFFHQKRTLSILCFLYAALWIYISISPHNRSDWMLENILVVLSVGVLVWTYKKFTFSTASYLLIFIFLSLHTIGSGYSYNVPWYDTYISSRMFQFDRLVVKKRYPYKIIALFLQLLYYDSSLTKTRLRQCLFIIHS